MDVVSTHEVVPSERGRQTRTVTDVLWLWNLATDKRARRLRSLPAWLAAVQRSLDPFLDFVRDIFFIRICPTHEQMLVRMRD